MPAPLSFAFWLQRINLISLVHSHDGSDAYSLSLFMGSCSEETGFRLPILLLFPPLQALMASRKPGGDAVTVAPTGRDFTGRTLGFLPFVTLMILQLSFERDSSANSTRKGYLSNVAYP